MNANGAGSKNLAADEIEPFLSLIWYPQLESLGVDNSSITLHRLDRGFYTLKITGQSAANTSVEKIEPSVRDNFRTRFFDPTWEHKDGQNALLPDSRSSRSYDTRVTFSPDGKWIAGIASYTVSATSGYYRRMCVIPADGSAPEHCAMSVEPCPTQSPVWSPDGTKIVFSGALKENMYACNLNELYVADAEMKNVFQLTNIDGPRMTWKDEDTMVKPGMKLDHWHKSSHPQWSPDGQWIAFMSYGGIYRVHPEGTGLHLIIRNGTFPAWSPDGKMLMYVVVTGSPFKTSGPSDRIFVAYADGSSPTEIPLDVKGPSMYTYRELNWAE
jgi:dipeptidyl aminopeptidase/acylaminoacyl peptidase